MKNREQLNDFLAAEEHKAFTVARISTGNASDALDVMQDAMLAFVSKYADSHEADWRALFYRIVYNKLTDFHRRRNFRQGILRFFKQPDETQESEQDQFPATGHSPEAALEFENSVTALEQALGQLPLRQQQAVILRAWQGLDTTETATAMQLSAGSVKTHYARGLAKLRELLQEEI